jgi:hypothetical protein
VSDNGTDNRSDPRWRDPLALGWQAHRRLLLLKLHWHQSSARRATGGGAPPTRFVRRAGRGRMPTAVHSLRRRQRTH